MQALEASLKTLLGSLPHGPDKRTLDSLVAETLATTKSKSPADIRKNQWEYVLKNEIFTLAATEGTALQDPNTTYYSELRERLDVVLTFTEHDACEQTVPFNVLQDLLETQTIASCSHIFSWIEERADRLTAGMVPQKGKALVLLRTLNDLLRRLSKMGNTTLFCGRILTFLSQVFPLGERSGVNLRGEYGSVWEGPGVKKLEPVIKTEPKKDAGEDKMQVDEPQAEEKPDPEAKKREQKQEFYETFWSLQLPFSRPPLFAEPGAFGRFKEAVNKVLPVIKEATAKERALMGSKTSSGGASHLLKRKRDSEPVEDNAGRDYFFARYLTSPELLDLEIADTHFRRQFLFQLLILLNHLLTFTKPAKLAWSTSRNRSLQIDFTLDPTDSQWVHEMAAKVAEELRQTSPNGRAFADTVHVVLEREKNWVRWKNELCLPFDKKPWAQDMVDESGTTRKVGLEEATREQRKKMRMDPEPWPHRLGSAPLTEIWAMGYRDLSDLEHPFQPGDVKDFVKKVKQEDARIDMRKKQLTKAAERIAQARAKAAAAREAAASPAKEPALAQETTAPAPAQTSPRPTSASAPLHPSLPAKPGTAPPTSASMDSVAQPTPALTPAPAPVATPSPAPAPAAPEPAPALPADEIIAGYEESKNRWAWLALRTARDTYLQHFGKIGTGDILLLMQEIEKEKKEREERERAATEETASPNPGANGAAAVSTGASDERSTSPTASAEKVGTKTEEAPVAATDGAQAAKDSEGDVKMEDR